MYEDYIKLCQTFFANRFIMESPNKERILLPELFSLGTPDQSVLGYQPC